MGTVSKLIVRIDCVASNCVGHSRLSTHNYIEVSFIENRKLTKHTSKKHNLLYIYNSPTGVLICNQLTLHISCGVANGDSVSFYNNIHSYIQHSLILY